MQDISSRMDAVCRRFVELSMRLNQPDTAADPALFRKLMREYHDTEPVVRLTGTGRPRWIIWRRPKLCWRRPEHLTRTSSR